jgi:hypothetical protein
MSFTRILAFLVLLSTTAPCAAQVGVADYGLEPADEAVIVRAAAGAADSLVLHHPMMRGERIMAITPEHGWEDNTADFYLLLSIFLLLGLIRLQDPRYFHALVRVFVNPALNSRLINEQMQAAKVSNLLMNLFFTISAGAYLYYVTRTFLDPPPVAAATPGLWMLLLIAGVTLVYLAKYLVIRLSGWAFRVETLTGFYLFNVFLVNKVLAIALLPFIVLLAFGEPAWAGTVVVVSFVVAGLLLLNRYLRSWQAFGSFFQYSRFHFFTYLCASELLPLAVLMKLAIRWML